MHSGGSTTGAAVAGGDPRSSLAKTFSRTGLNGGTTNSEGLATGGRGGIVVVVVVDVVVVVVEVVVVVVVVVVVDEAGTVDVVVDVVVVGAGTVVVVDVVAGTVIVDTTPPTPDPFVAGGQSEAADVTPAVTRARPPASTITATTAPRRPRRTNVTPATTASTPITTTLRVEPPVAGNTQGSMAGQGGRHPPPRGNPERQPAAGGAPTQRRGLLLLPGVVSQRRRDIAARVEDPPDVDLVNPLDVEDQEGESGERPRAQLGDVEVVGEAERSAVGVPAHVPQCVLNGSDEAPGDVRARFGEEMVDRGLDVVGGPPTQPDRLGHDSGLAVDAAAQGGEVGAVSDRSRIRPGSGEQERAKPLAVLVAADQRADVLAGGTEAALVDLGCDEATHLVGQRHVHRRHALIVPPQLASFASAVDAELDAEYAAYDAHPLDEPDQWGDLASFREAAAAT